MNNFKDYLNFSPNPRDNFFKLSQISLQENHYMKLCESLKEKINLLEAKIKKKMKMANKDYDGDGKVESSKDEYFGSKDKAIKAAMKKKKSLKEGREVVSGGLIYGGFPKVLKEQKDQGGVVGQFNDSDDSNPSDEKIATQPDSSDEEVATQPDSLAKLQARLAKMQDQFDQAESDLSDSDSRWSRTMAGRAMQGKILAMQDSIRQHPETQAKMAAAEAARAAEGPGFFSQRGAKPDPFYRIDTPAERGLNMGGNRLPPTVYDLGKSGRKER